MLLIKRKLNVSVKQLKKKKIFAITISLILVILEIFAGINITNFVEYNNDKKLEEIRLKAKIVEYKIDKVTELLALVQKPVLIVKTKNNSELAAKIDGCDANCRSCVTILTDLDTFNEWAVKFQEFTFENRYLFNEEINLYITQIYLYNQKLEEILYQIPAEDIWQVGVVLHGEISNMYATLSGLLQDYLNNDIYNLDSDDISSYSRVVELSPEFDIVKYEKEIISILGDKEN